jgi:hypothetical protein
MVDKWLERLRGATRPVATMTLIWTLCAVIIHLAWKAVVPDLGKDVWIMIIGSFTTAVAAAMAFWFGSRNRPVS